jgi:two-component system LytT family response regulator
MTLPLRAAIVDDEPLARARLGRLLAAEPEVEVVAEYADGPSAVSGLRALPVDVVFLDVRMPQLDGFGMLERLPPSQRPQVVFVTAYSEHAVEAFDARAVDYLVKPVAPDRLSRSVERVRTALARQAVPSTVFPERIAVSDGQRLRMVAVQDIECVLAQGNYVELRIEGRGVLVRETLAHILARLDPMVFVRIHRSRIVRVDRIDQVEPHASGQYVVRMHSGLRLTSGRSYRAELRRALGLPEGERLAGP